MLRALAPLSREVAGVELLDRPGLPRAELAGSLRDIARLNRIGPTRTLLGCLVPFLERAPGGRPLRVLDVGTGGADIPAALARWARARGRLLTVVGLDVQPAVLACAAATTAGLPEVRLVAAEALTPPIRPDGVDLAICSLVLHHLPERGVVRLLGLLASLARLGFVVSDLRRSRAAYAAAWLATRAISRNRLTRHDGPLSVRRAWTRAELTRLGAAAGLRGVSWFHAPAFRVVGVYDRQAASRAGR